MPKKPDRYATILRVRKRDEDTRAAALARALSAVRNAETNRETLVSRHADTLRRASDAGKGTSARLMDQFALYERHLTQLIAHADRDIEELRNDRQRCQEDFKTSHRRRKVIDRLMERVGERWETHMRREERKSLEDAVTMRHSFRRDKGKSR